MSSINRNPLPSGMGRFKVQLLILFLCLCLVGCASLPQNRHISYPFAWAGQAADFGSSAVLLNQEGYKEGNKILNCGDRETTLWVMGSAKIVLLALDYYCGDDVVDWVIGGVGFAAGTWNTYLGFKY